MNLLRKLCGATVLLALAAVACGDDEPENSAAKLESCKKVCDKSASASCGLTIPADVCKQFCDVHAQAPAACQDALKSLSDCQLTQADVCAGTGCEAQDTAYEAACNTK
jgi:hypothetical protein